MTYGPPPEPNAHPGSTQPHPGPNNPQQPGPHPPQPGPNNPQQPTPYPQQAGPNYPQHLWPDYAQQPGPGTRGGSPAAGPSKGFGLLAVASLILGLAGLAAPLLPMAMDGFRQYAAFPFALPGLALAIAGLTGRRRAKPLAAIGAILSVLALAIGAFMVVTYALGR